MEVWEPSPSKPIILNLPATVEWTTPNVHADQIEWFCNNLNNRDSAIISLHTHNDRGTGTAATELGLMAGANRVEGTLFGNGERTGNLDIATVALNMNSHGIETGLDFSDIPKAREVYERCTQMKVPDGIHMPVIWYSLLFQAVIKTLLKRAWTKFIRLIAHGLYHI